MPWKVGFSRKVLGVGGTEEVVPRARDLTGGVVGVRVRVWLEVTGSVWTYWLGGLLADG